MKITVSAIKADVGGIGGHTRPSDGLLDAVKSQFLTKTAKVINGNNS